MTRPVSRLALLQYAFLALPLAFAGFPLYINAPDFYATQAGLSLTLIGTVLLFIRLFDAIQDPVIGFLSNKFSAYRPSIMIASLVVMALGFLMLFHPPEKFTLIWFILSLVLTTTAFSVLSINFNTIGSLWSTDTTDKTRITSWREALGLIGLLIAAILPSVFGLSITSIIVVVLLGVSGFIFLQWYKRRKEIIAENESVFTVQNWRCLLTNTNVAFFGVYSLSMLASAIPAVLVLFFIRDRLDAENLTGLFLLLYFLSGAIGMPLWQYMARRTNKPTAWLIAILVAIATFIGAYFLQAGDVWPYAIICILSGLALGAELALPPAILSDMIDDQEARDQTSLYFAILAFLSKAALALGSFIAFFVLGKVSFVPAAENSADALHSLSITYALLPCFIKIIAAYFLWQNYKYQKGDIHAQTERTHSHGINSIS